MKKFVIVSISSLFLIVAIGFSGVAIARNFADTSATQPTLASADNLSLSSLGIRALTEQEKADCITIASQHPSVVELVKNPELYRAGLEWIGVFPSGGHGLLSYDVYEKGVIPDLEWVKNPATKFYPAVYFRTSTYVHTFAIDLNTRTIVFVTGGQIRTGPVRQK